MNVLYTLLGAALVLIGVFASAIADRIRGIKVSRTGTLVGAATDPLRVESAKRPLFTPEAKRALSAPLPDPLLEEVIGALVAVGYKRPLAATAVNSCTPAERNSLETWTAAALRRCGKGAMS